MLKIVKKLLAMWTDSPFLRSVVKSPVVEVSAVYLIRRILFKFSTRTFMIVPEQFNQDLTTMYFFLPSDRNSVLLNLSPDEFRNSKVEPSNQLLSYGGIDWVSSGIVDHFYIHISINLIFLKMFSTASGVIDYRIVF